MRFSRLTLAAVFVLSVATVALFAGRTAVFAAAHAPATSAAASQEPPPPPSPSPSGPGGPGGPPPGFKPPAPTNLKVLPRNLTGEQVHEIMEKWEGELGTGCKTCHTVDRKNIGPDGKPGLNFADDSKEEKQTARKMVEMVDSINANYIAKIDSSGDPVTCGTCHRGHLGPEPFVPKPRKDDHEHPAAP